MSTILDNFFNRKSIKIVIAVAIVLLVIYPFVIQTKKSFAEEISLFPTICEGSWKNASEAAGDPADNLLTGAQSGAVGDMITCHSFDASSLLEGATITDAHLEFLWAGGDDQNKVIEPSIEESYDSLVLPGQTEQQQPGEGEQTPEILDTNLDDSKPSLETEQIQQKESNLEEEIQSSDSVKEPVDTTLPEPTSRLQNWIFSFLSPIAHAEEELSTNVSEENNIQVDSIEKSPESTILPQSTNDTPSLESNQTEENSDQGTIDLNSENSNTTDDSIGTALFDSSYSIKNTEKSLGNITHEHLSKLYSVPLVFDDIATLKVSLKSLMTIDQIDTVSLQGIKLIITYNTNKSLDPIRQPDLSVDVILDNITVEATQVIRIRRDDNKKYEIWYRTGVPIFDTSKNKKDDENVLNLSVSDQPILQNEHTISETFKPVDKSISTKIPPSSLLEKDINEEKVIETTNSAENIPVESTTTNQPVVDQSWNFVAGPELVNDTLPIAFKDLIIFWIDAHGGALYAFNIATQGIMSRSYNPEVGDDYIIYRNPYSEEKKAIFDFSTKEFIFP